MKQWLWLLPAILLVSACASTQGVPESPADTSAALVDANEYIIGPGDVLDISVWKKEELAREVPVRPDGRITLPLLGDIMAAGLTPDALKVKLTEAYKRYVELPEVTVVVSAVNSYKIFVQGQVSAPGIYPIIGRTTVVQAVSLAGGFTEFAARGRIVVLRQTNKGTERVVVDYDRIVSGKDPDFVLRPGDTVIVP